MSCADADLVENSMLRYISSAISESLMSGSTKAGVMYCNGIWNVGEGTTSGSCSDKHRLKRSHEMNSSQGYVEECMLEDCMLEDCILEDCMLEECMLEECMLEECMLEECMLEEYMLEECMLEEYMLEMRVCDRCRTMSGGLGGWKWASWTERLYKRGDVFHRQPAVCRSDNCSIDPHCYAAVINQIGKFVKDFENEIHLCIVPRNNLNGTNDSFSREL